MERKAYANLFITFDDEVTSDEAVVNELDKGITALLDGGNFWPDDHFSPESGSPGVGPLTLVPVDLSSHWDEDPEYPVEDWKIEVDNDDTRLGYKEWVLHQRESQAEDD